MITSNPGQVYGYDRGVDTSQYIAAADINGPVLVSIDANGKVATTATNGAPRLVVGVCLNSPRAGEVASVAKIGQVVKDVPSTGTVNAGDFLTRSSTTAGSVAASATPSVGDVVGVAVTGATNNKVTVYVFKA